LHLKVHRDLLEAELSLIEAQSEFEVLSEMNSQVKEMLEARKREVETVEKEYEATRKAAKKILTEVEAMCRERTDDESKFHLDNRNMTMEELEAEIDSARARIEFLHGGNPDAIKQFEQRQTHIDELRKRLADMERDLTRLQEGIVELRSKWEPELDGLVRQIGDAFSYNFNKIGCAGQVGIYKDEDFDQWAIQIQVKFRYASQAVSTSPLQVVLILLTRLVGNTNSYLSSTRTANPAANEQCRQSSISWPFNPSLDLPSESSTRSTKVWTLATNVWFTNAWWTSRAKSTRAST
jgi:hypothetical protein